MSESEFVCKHCGSDDIYVDVEARGSVGGFIGEENGEPRFERDWHIDYDDVNHIDYTCRGCKKHHWRLEELVTPRAADDELLRPCGRCDHDIRNHKLYNVRHASHFTRGPMPCSAEGCDCHDYYDLAIANAGIYLEAA